MAKKLETLKDLFVEELRDLYSAEKQIIKALPKMRKAANSDQLKAAFEEHLEQTKGHVARLEQIFEALGEKPTGKTCKAMEGLVEEGSEMIAEKAEPAVKDAGLIAAAQRVEHYEMAGYGTVADLRRAPQAQRRGQAPPGDARRGGGHRREAHHPGRDQHQPPGRLSPGRPPSPRQMEEGPGPPGPPPKIIPVSRAST